MKIIRYPKEPDVPTEPDLPRDSVGLPSVTLDKPCCPVCTSRSQEATDHCNALQSRGAGLNSMPSLNTRCASPISPIAHIILTYSLSSGSSSGTAEAAASHVRSSSGSYTAIWVKRNGNSLDIKLRRFSTIDGLTVNPDTRTLFFTLVENDSAGEAFALFLVVYIAWSLFRGVLNLF